jgi:hypothetical protein
MDVGTRCFPRPHDRTLAPHANSLASYEIRMRRTMDRVLETRVSSARALVRWRDFLESSACSSIRSAARALWCLSNGESCLRTHLPPHLPLIPGEVATVRAFGVAVSFTECRVFRRRREFFADASAFRGDRSRVLFGESRLSPQRASVRRVATMQTSQLEAVRRGGRAVCAARRALRY